MRHPEPRTSGRAAAGLTAWAEGSTQRGRLPLRLRGAVPPSGLLEIVVAEPQPPGGDSFRGAYHLRVEAGGIRRDRTLEPRRDVEP